MIDILIIILGYFIGSLTWGIILTKVIKKSDIREKDYPGGSGVTRQFGLSLGSIVGLLDILKGSLIAYIAIKYSKTDLTIILSYITLILGNNYPIYFEFKGGQGVGATIGFGLTLFPIETLVSFLIGSLFSLMFHFLKF
ncbi:MAG: glycerol-3-phosphate acyltransferase, partial [Candidatus Ratteibacteria bacterium]